MLLCCRPARTVHQQALLTQRQGLLDQPLKVSDLTTECEPTVMHLAREAFHIQAVKSSLPATTKSPTGCHRSHSMPSVGPSSSCSFLPVLASMIITSPARAGLLSAWRRLGTGCLEHNRMDPC